jgi:hypothetical protein
MDGMMTNCDDVQLTSTPIEAAIKLLIGVLDPAAMGHLDLVMCGWSQLGSLS